MAVDSAEIYRILFTVSRWLFPFFAVLLVLYVLIWLVSDSAERREKKRSLPGSGTVGEMVVLSGGRDLAENSWFPVPREGVLGAIRSCDLVIPCTGVHSRHLDFSWKDGLGLLIYPRTGCEVLINGMPVTCRTDASAVPMSHGSVLQVGSAVLRLHLFAALDHLPLQRQDLPPAELVQPSFRDMPVQPEVYSPQPGPPACGAPFSTDIPSVPDSLMSKSAEAPAMPDPLSSGAPEPHQSDLWKEDIGE